MYLFGSKLLTNKFINLALSLIFGLGKSVSTLIIKKAGFCLNLKIKNLLKNQIYKLIRIAQNLNIFFSHNFKKFKYLIFKKFFKLKLIKNFRKKNGLPVRGQRTHTNAKTIRKQTYYLD